MRQRTGTDNPILALFLASRLSARRIAICRSAYYPYVTADTALRLGLYFDMEPRLWLNLQAEYDMRVATRELRDKIAPRVRVFHSDRV